MDSRDGRLLDHLRVRGPLLFERVAVDPRRPWPRVARLQDQSAVQRKPQEIRQLAVLLRVARDQKGLGHLTAGDRRWRHTGRQPSPSTDRANRYPADMAQFSFDIVSEIDIQEVRNAVDQASREIHQRFDFKNTGTTVALEDEKIE